MTMPDNIGEMFYTGEMPWHRKGLALAKPATMNEALRAGGLDWRVGETDLLTADDPASPVPMRKALVRLDRPLGHPERVLGVAHRGFQPLQNRDGAMLFDAIFGRGNPVYHTGGYLGRGHVVWLLAKIDKPLTVARDDVVQPYALFANSHDGSMAIRIRLTTVRVVCQNTLAVALREQRFGKGFQRSHRGTFQQHAEAAHAFFAATIKELDYVAENFVRLAKRPCNDDQFNAILGALLPEPSKPRNADANRGSHRAWEANVDRVRKARKHISDLRQSGRGMNLDGSKGTFWGVLNAVLEFVDHHQEATNRDPHTRYWAREMDLKSRAFNLILKKAA
jgi:phage/plasmid-like protein (TIGR03299 family)